MYLNSQQTLPEGDIFPSHPQRRSGSNDMDFQSLDDLVINISFARAKNDQIKHGHNHHKKHHNQKRSHRRSKSGLKNKKKRKLLTRIN